MIIENLIRFGPDKFQYWVLKYITRGRVTDIGIKVIQFVYDCREKNSF